MERMVAARGAIPSLAGENFRFHWARGMRQSSAAWKEGDEGGEGGKKLSASEKLRLHLAKKGGAQAGGEDRKPTKDVASGGGRGGSKETSRAGAEKSMGEAQERQLSASEKLRLHLVRKGRAEARDIEEGKNPEGIGEGARKSMAGSSARKPLPAQFPAEVVSTTGTVEPKAPRVPGEGLRKLQSLQSRGSGASGTSPPQFAVYRSPDRPGAGPGAEAGEPAQPRQPGQALRKLQSVLSRGSGASRSTPPQFDAYRSPDRPGAGSGAEAGETAPPRKPGQGLRNLQSILSRDSGASGAAPRELASYRSPDRPGAGSGADSREPAVLRQPGQGLRNLQAILASRDAPDFDPESDGNNFSGFDPQRGSRIRRSWDGNPISDPWKDRSRGPPGIRRSRDGPGGSFRDARSDRNRTDSKGRSRDGMRGRERQAKEDKNRAGPDRDVRKNYSYYSLTEKERDEWYNEKRFALMMADPAMSSHESVFLPEEGRERESVFSNKAKDELRAFLMRHESDLIRAFPPAAKVHSHSDFVKAVDRAVKRFERWRTAGRVTLSAEEMDAKVIEARYRHILPHHPQWEFAEAALDLVRLNSSWSLSKKIRFFQELGRDYATFNLKSVDELMLDQLEDHQLEEVLRVPLHVIDRADGTQKPVQDQRSSFMGGGPDDRDTLVGQLFKFRKFVDADKVSVREGDQRKEFDFNPAYNRKALEGKPGRKK